MITAARLRTEFSAIMDLTGSDYFPDPEIDKLLNIAYRAMYKQFLDPDGTANKVPGKNAYWESSEKISNYLHPFLKKVATNTDANGYISLASLELIAGRGHWGLVGWTGQCSGNDLYPVKWSSHGETAMQQNMAFFQPSCCNITLRYDEGGYQFHPKEEITFSGHLLLEPLDISDTQDCEFDSELIGTLANRAAELASIATGNQEAYMEIQQQIEQRGV